MVWTPNLIFLALFFPISVGETKFREMSFYEIPWTFFSWDIKFRSLGVVDFLTSIWIIFIQLNLNSITHTHTHTHTHWFMHFARLFPVHFRLDFCQPPKTIQSFKISVKNLHRCRTQNVEEDFSFNRDLSEKFAAQRIGLNCCPISPAYCPKNYPPLCL